ncbi:MAG: aminotransferase class V-fold PLP-dependent enzyme, partial [Nanoarchaeota archaeon]
MKPATTKQFIPVCEPTLRGKELEYVTDAVNSGWISSAGKYIIDFEEKFSKYCGVKYGASCSNGTKAIHLALMAVGIKAGDEVILPSFTMIGSCNPIVQIGAKPVFVDSELKTWNMDTEQIENKITSKTKAIMVVHIYGHPVDKDVVLKIARNHNLIVIEDAAEAHGAEYKGRIAGSRG